MLPAGLVFRLLPTCAVCEAGAALSTFVATCADRTEFAEIVFSDSMVVDHFPYLYEDAIVQAFLNL